MSEAREGNVKRSGFNLNECASSLTAELDEESGMERVHILPSEAERLADDAMETTPNGGNMKNIAEMTKRETIKLKPVDREVNITRRVLRSGSVAMDPANCNKRPRALEEKRNGSHKVVLSLVDNMGTSSVDESKEYVKHGHVESHLTKETHGDDERSDNENVSFEPHGKEVQVKPSRRIPRKLQISCQFDVNEDKFNRVNDDEEDKSGVQLENEQSAEAKKICGAEFSSQVDVEIEDDRSYDKNGNAEPYDKGPNVKCKRGRPKKVQTSSQSEESGSNTNCKLARTPDLSSQSDSRVCRGRKMVRKRGRPPKPRMNRKSEDTDESDCKAKKRLKLRERSLESHHNNPLVVGGKRIEEHQNKPKEAGRQSKSESKKLLSDRIQQLLLAAGWTVQYRPRNGRDYNDAVYVNPEGKTHWSVTKAYKGYKEQLESIMKDPMNSTTSSNFGLLPEEDLQLLERNTQKQRSDKGKQRPNWKDRDTNENISTKRVGKHTLHGKKLEKERKRMQKKRKESNGLHNVERVSVSVRKIKKEEIQSRKRCAISARSSLEDPNSKENGYVLFEGKRTVLGWMIDSAIVPLNGRVQCMDCEKTQVLLEGIITKEGIRCNCCDKVFSVFDFEVHSGGKHNQSFKSLYLESGDSVLQCFLESWNKQRESLLKGFHFVDFGGGDKNDDTCGICGDGGDLICCDGCPSTFHQSCLGIKKFPSGAWFCCYCSCKFCDKVEAANQDPAALSPLSRCRLCEEKYHRACIGQDGTVPGERSTLSFCGKYCQELFEGLQLLIGVKQTLPEGFSWTFLRRFELPCDVSDSDISEKIAYNAKLAVAFSVMDECFSPLIDHRSGVNLLENIVYNFGSNFHRLNYSSFLTAILERGDEIIAVASIRIHGIQLAEMPFIGTRYMYRRQGMCRRLMSGIESALGSLKVDKLVIPAVPELMDTWISGFGFKPIHDPEKEKIKNLNLVVFPGVDMLEKIIEPKVSSSTGYLLLAPEMNLSVDAEENKPEESRNNDHGQNFATADVETPSYPVDSCLKLRNVEERDNDAKSVLESPNGSVWDKERIGKLTDKDVDSHPDVVDNEKESNSEVADDSHQDQGDTERLECGDLEDKKLSNDGCGGKAEGTEESDEQLDSYIIEDSQPLGSGGREKEIENKTLALKKEVTSRLRVSPRLIQRSWDTPRVKKKYTGTDAVLLDSPHRYV